MSMELFLEIHREMPRQGPGDRDSSRWAFESLGDLPNGVRVLDIGCGPGAQTVDLARWVEPLGGEVFALDFFDQYLDEARRNVEQAGLQNVTFHKGDMKAIPFEDASFDVIWSEGSIYIMGFENGLKEWKRLLKPGGVLAVSEISWLREDSPGEVRAFWAEGYPAMQTIDGNLQIAERCGWRVLDHFTLPPKAWLANYYDPLEQRFDALKAKYMDNPSALALLAAEASEIGLYRKHPDCYSYEFFIMQL